jgi:hypothetical protein
MNCGKEMQSSASIGNEKEKGFWHESSVKIS